MALPGTSHKTKGALVQRERGYDSIVKPEGRQELCPAV